MIRCKDCVYSWTKVSPYGTKERRCELLGSYGTDLLVSDDFFCANGSRCHEGKTNKDAEDEFGWHDLVTDPNDIPEKTGYYIACTQLFDNEKTRLTKPVILNGYKDSKPVWRKFAGRLGSHEKVLAWRKMRKYED